MVLLKNNQLNSQLSNNNLKKKGNNLLLYILQNLYKSNFLFFRIHFIKMSYKDILAFLKSHGDKEFQEFYKHYPLEKMENAELGILFIKYLAKKIQQSPRFECCLFFYKFNSDHISLDLLLGLKLLGFDSLSFIEIYLCWFFKLISHFITIVFLVSWDVVKLFFFNKVEHEHIYYLFNSSYTNYNYQHLFRTYFLYNFFEEFLSYFRVKDIDKVLVLGSSNSFYPSALSIVDKPDYKDIIYILTLYLTHKNAFLDVNSGFIYRYLSITKSTFVYMCSLQELNINFLQICYFLKNYIKKDFIASFEFLNTNFPFLHYDISCELLEQKKVAFSYLQKDPLLLQNLNSVVFNIFEFTNGYYVINENSFYSFKLLSLYQPTNVIKEKRILSYNFKNKAFRKNYFLKHSFMLFLKGLSKSSKHFFTKVFSVFFNKGSKEQNFIFILRLSKNNKKHLLMFLKQIYCNSPFIFLDYNCTSYNNDNSLSFSKELPLFINTNKITELIANHLHKLYSRFLDRPSTIVLLVDLDTDLSFLDSIFLVEELCDTDCVFDELINQFILYRYNIDLFIILNMFFYDSRLLENKNLFLNQFRQSKFFDFFDEVEEESL